MHHLPIVTGVLGQHILPVFKGKAVQKEMDYLTHKDINSMVPKWFITDSKSMPCDNPERSPVVIWDFTSIKQHKIQYSYYIALKSKYEY